jgi:hypothetical protein
LSDIGDAGGDITGFTITSLDDLSSVTTNSGVVPLVTNGSVGITTSIDAGPILNITGTDASTSAKGVVELATTAETTTGTDTARAVTPDGLKDGFEGSANIETVGEITTGSWNADVFGTGSIPALPTSKITSGTFANARIASGNVTQHVADIDHDSLSNFASNEHYTQANIVETGALDSGSITSGFTSIDVGSGAITTTGTLTGSNGVCQGTKHKHFVTGTHRMRATADSKWYGGRNQDYYKQSEFFGLSVLAGLDGFFSDTTATGWVVLSYADFIAPADCTVTNFNASAYQNNADSGVTLALWKGVIADNDSHTANQTVANVAKIVFAENADTSSLHASTDTGDIKASSANLDKGDVLFVVMKRDDSGGDATYWYFNWGIEIEYG